MSVAPVTPARALRDRVEAFDPAVPLVAISDSESYSDRVLVGVRTPTAVFVMTIDRAEYDGREILKILGFREGDPDEFRPDAMTRAREAQKVKPK